MALITATVLFAVFLGNVLLGALSGSPILNDVAEMLVLLAASVAFVATILHREKTAARRTNNSTDQGGSE